MRFGFGIPSLATLLAYDGPAQVLRVPAGRYRRLNDVGRRVDVGVGLFQPHRWPRLLSSRGRPRGSPDCWVAASTASHEFAQPSMTQDIYLGRRAANPGLGRILELP
jgi:hypothetical protein